ncbi:MAG: c-type cytochrome biogenesis protein CcsB [Actinomycetota bacterium]|nr:c-type cytochrome biogenesis protein CcsB [Actinomycetota bacterium]
MSMTQEIVLMWTAVSVYAAGSVLLSVGFVFAKERLLRLGAWVSIAGLLPHLAATAVRWVRVGHGPYLGFYEVVSGLAISTVVLYGLIAWRYPKLAPTGVILMPISFITLAAAMFAPKSAMEVTGKLASWWLTIHVAFAKLSYAAFIAGFVLGIVYLLRERGYGERMADVLAKLPSQAVVDDLEFRFVAVGFIFLGVMIAAGAVWANEAWGRYWSWDPIETWSLISWIVYAAYLHLRLTLGWKGTRSAWVAVLALPVVVFALIGVPLVYSSIHGAYLTG